MAIQPPNAEAIERGQAELKEQLMPAQTVPPANLEAIRILAGVHRFEFPRGSGIWYSVPRVPYSIGNQIQELYLLLREQAEYPEQLRSPRIYMAYLHEILNIAWKHLVVPEDWSTKILKFFRVMPNPLRKMSDQEIAELIGFFLARRMMSSVNFHYPA